MVKKYFLLALLLITVIWSSEKASYSFGESIIQDGKKENDSVTTDDSTASGENDSASGESDSASGKIASGLEKSDAASGESDAASAGSDEKSNVPEDVSPSISDALTEEQSKILQETSESFSFQTEVNRLMDIIINSLYTQKEVFLREIISNAADALEKARFLSISNPDYLKETPELEIRVEMDPALKTITIQDTGIGMTKDELIQNLGTVARSGTTNFLEAVTESGDLNLIGQFGVGFYSAFLVADRVIVASKSHNDTEQHIWESRIGGTFTVGKDPRGNTLGRGTKITLHLKDDSTEYLDEKKVESVIIRFNQFINFPIKIRKEVEPVKEGSDKKTEPVDETKTEEKQPEESEAGDKNDTTTASEAPSPQPNYKWEVVNLEKPLWMRPKESITEKEYHDFYMNFARDSEPAAYTHFTAEGDVEFKALLFVPKRQPIDSYSSYFNAKQEAIRLYSRRVLVADSVYELLPKWLGFIRGIVDSDDLPLKVDRESFSQLKVISVIRNKIVAKFLEMIHKLSKQDREEWAKYHEEVDKLEENSEKKDQIKTPATTFGRIWNIFGRNIKIGCVEDPKSRKRIAKISRFLTSKLGEEEKTTLEEYVSRMKEGQKDIYYIAAEKYNAALNAPHMQFFRKKDYEVLILIESLDEPCLERLRDYDGKRLLSIEKANVKFDTDVDKIYEKRVRKAYQPLIKAWTKLFENRLRSVRLTFRLVDDPVVITVDEHGSSAYGDRIARTQLFNDRQQADFAWASRHLEINPNHPLIKKMLNLAKESPEDSQLKDMGNILLDSALMSSGFVINDPTVVSRKLYKLLQSNVGISEDEPLSDYELTEAELEYNPEESSSASSPNVESTEMSMDDEDAKSVEKESVSRGAGPIDVVNIDGSPKQPQDFEAEIDRIDAQIQDKIYKKTLADFESEAMKEAEEEEKELEESLSHDEL